MTQALVHLFLQHFAGLDIERRAGLAEHLNADDYDRLSRHPESRARQIVARGLLREQLAAAANCEPWQLSFARNAGGKPWLQNAPIAFNVSHSHEACAIAWSLAPLHLGVDIEDMSRSLHEAKLAAHAFSPGEIHAWQNAAQPRRRWLAIWTRKEALLKATGHGIRLSLASVDTERGEPPGSFSHPKLGALQFRSWAASEQVFSLAWVERSDLTVRVKLSGTLPGFEPVVD